MPDEAPVTIAVLRFMIFSLPRDPVPRLLFDGMMGILPSRRTQGEVPMRYAPEHNEATRERIVEAASRLFREHGIAAVGLAKIMAEADLTVGTFYTHFESKEALLRDALLQSLQARHGNLERALHRG